MNDYKKLKRGKKIAVYGVVQEVSKDLVTVSLGTIDNYILTFAPQDIIQLKPGLSYTGKL